MTATPFEFLADAPAREDFPDLEVALLDWLEDGRFSELAGGGHVGTETPSDLDTRFPFVRVVALDGQDDGITDRAAVDVDVFSATRAQARALAERIRTSLTVYPPVVGDVVIDSVFTEVRPRRLPWPDENTRRWGATYRISARR